VTGNVGTHVTMELFGEKDKRNPHYFHGAGAGVPNALAGKAEWTDIEAALNAKLTAEMNRLQNLVQDFINRNGKWPGDD
jgi:hypothetical protein